MYYTVGSSQILPIFFSSLILPMFLNPLILALFFYSIFWSFPYSVTFSIFWYFSYSSILWSFLYSIILWSFSSFLSSYFFHILYSSDPCYVLSSSDSSCLKRFDIFHTCDSFLLDPSLIFFPWILPKRFITFYLMFNNANFHSLPILLPNASFVFPIFLSYLFRMFQYPSHILPISFPFDPIFFIYCALMLPSFFPC